MSNALELLERAAGKQYEWYGDSIAWSLLGIIRAAMAEQNTPVQCGPERPVDKSGHYEQNAAGPGGDERLRSAPSTRVRGSAGPESADFDACTQCITLTHCKRRGVCLSMIDAEAAGDAHMATARRWATNEGYTHVGEVCAALLSHIAALEARVKDKDRKWCRTDCIEAQRLTADRDRLAADNARLAKDAERYRYVRIHRPREWHYMPAEVLDSVIDAAIDAQQPAGKGEA